MKLALTCLLAALAIAGKMALPHVVLARGAQLPKPVQAMQQPAAAPQPTAAPLPAEPVEPIEPRQLRPTLQQVVNEIAASAPAATSIIVHDYVTDARGEHQPEQQLPSASLYKLFVAYAAYSQLDAGELAPGDPVPGAANTVSGCLELMITISDNTCGYGLGMLIGFDALDNRLQQEGYLGTKLDNTAGATIQKTTAHDVALLLTRLYQGTLVSPASTDAFFGLLKSQKRNQWLPQGLPPAATPAHKTGDLHGYAHDAGIVFSPNGNYMMVVMSGPWQSQESAKQFYRSASEDIWQFLQPSE